MLKQLFCFQKSIYEESLGNEIVGPLKKDEVLSIIHRFYTDKEIKEIAKEQGLDSKFNVYIIAKSF